MLAVRPQIGAQDRLVVHRISGGSVDYEKPQRVRDRPYVGPP